MSDITDRRARLATAGIAVIADRGMRALTHRAVEQAAELPPGTASYHFSTRKELIRAVLNEIALVSRRRLEDASPGPGAGSDPPPEQVLDRAAAIRRMAIVCGAFIAGQLTDYRTLTLARYALEAEVATDPELVEILHAGDQFHHLAANACRTLGVADPEAAGSHLIAFMDGIVHDRLVGSSSLRPGSVAEVVTAAKAAIEAYLRGLLMPTWPVEPASATA